MEARFGYRRDKRCKWLTAVYILLTLAAISLVLIFVGSGYMQAWILSVIGAVLLLYILSIPRYVKVDDDYLEIHCVVEMTRIDVRDIVSIRRAGRCEYRRRLACILGSYGFFGYYGYWLDYRQWDFIKMYATERQHLVVIDDIYEQTYIISCRDCDRLIEAVSRARLEQTEAGE